MTRSIIDISHWEGEVDFKKVANSGIVAVIAKATEGATGVDSAYAKFKTTAAPYNFLWGSYHFGTGIDADAQVDHYLAVAAPSDRELVCLDFEPNPEGPTMSLAQAREFVSLVQKKLGRYPVLYSGVLLKESLKGKPDDPLSKCPLWLSQYGSKAVLPPGWTNYTLWQYTDGESGPLPDDVPGIGPCDHNQYDGSITQLRTSWPFMNSE